MKKKLVSMHDAIKVMDHEKLNQEIEYKQYRKQLIEMEEKVSKDIDREKKLQDELNQLKNNFDLQRKELEKLTRDKHLAIEEKEDKNVKMRTLEEKQEQFQKDIANLNQSLIEYEQKYKEQTKIKRELMAEKNEYRKQIEQRKKELTEQNTRNTQLEKRLNKLKNSLRAE